MHVDDISILVLTCMTSSTPDITKRYLPEGFLNVGVVTFLLFRAKLTLKMYLTLSLFEYPEL